MPNFAEAFGMTPLQQLSTALGSAVANAPQKEAALQTAGQAILATYKAQANADYRLARDPNFIAKITRISKMYHLPVPMLGTEGGSWDAADADPSAPAGEPAAGSAPTNGTPVPGTAQPSPQSAAAQSGAQGALQAGTMAFGNRMTPQGPPAPGAKPGDIGMPAAQQQPNAGAQAPQQQPVGAQPATQPQTPPQQAVGPNVQPPSGSRAPDGLESFMRRSDEGPMRINLNAWLGRTVSLQDMATLSAMPPDQRRESLKQAGYDPLDFSPKWLNAEPTLSPTEQVKLAQDASTAIGKDIQQGATMEQIKLSLATYRPYLTKEQNAEIDSNISDTMSQSLQIRAQQAQSLGLWRQDTIARWNRQDSDREQNVSWDHNYKYQVLNDRNAQFSSRMQLEAQNASVRYQQLQTKIAEDQANGLLDANGRPLKAGAGGVKPGELITTARGLLSSINGEINEYNGRITNALAQGVMGGKGGVNPLMESNIQDQIDAYNRTVDMLRARGISAFSHYTGPDQNTMNATTAKDTAGQALNAQGISTPNGSIPGWHAEATLHGRTIGRVNGTGSYVYSDGTPAK